MKYRIEYAEEGSTTKIIGHAETMKEARAMASEKIRSAAEGKQYYWCGSEYWIDDDDGWHPAGGYSTKHCELATVIYKAAR